MLTLIAESKTMSPCDAAVTPGQAAAHTPLFQSRADAIVRHLATLSAPRLSTLIGLSPALARRLFTDIREFADRSHGSDALDAFTGVVYKALGAATLTAAQRDFADSHVRIVSSLYGLLRPSDIIKPYRLEFAAPIAPDGLSATRYWQQPVTDRLIEDLEASGSTDILDLLPTEASRCVDRKLLARHATVWKAAFREMLHGGDFRTPPATRLKTLRGQLLRLIITENIDSPHDIVRLRTDLFIIEPPTADAPDVITLTTAR